MTSSKELASKWANPSLLLRRFVFRKVEASDWWWAARDHGKGLPAFLCARARDVWVRGRANLVTGIRFAFCSNGKFQHGFQAEIPVRLLFHMGNFSSVTEINKKRPFTYRYSGWMEKYYPDPNWKNETSASKPVILSYPNTNKSKFLQKGLVQPASQIDT